MTGLVRLAINKYVLSKELADVSEALERLLAVDVLSRMGLVLPAPDVFRRGHAYTSEVNETLRRHETSLRALFGGLTERSKLLNFETWQAFMGALDFIDVDTSMRDTAMCFLWAVMCVGDNSTPRGKQKETHLPFEGFLEALCRLATLKALPTDAEIQQAGYSDAATYMAMLRRHDVAAYDRMLAERACKWGDVPLTQPLARCIDHLLFLVIRRVEGTDESAGGNVQVSESEIKKWLAGPNCQRLRKSLSILQP